MDKNFIVPELNSERWLSLDDFPDEQWRDVVDYEGLYKVSNYGRVKSVERNVLRSSGKTMLVRERILKVTINKKYVYLSLSKGGHQPKAKAHRLTAQAFLPNPDNLPQVNHKDENTINNYIHINTDGSVNMEKSNLEWCTEKYNREYGTLNQRLKETWRKKYGVCIIRYNLDGSISKVYECGKDVEYDGFGRRAVYANCNHKTLTYKGFVWRFKDDPFSLRSSIVGIKVYKYDLNNNLIRVYDRISDAEKDNGMTCSLRSMRYGDRRKNVINGYRYSFTPL